MLVTRRCRFDADHPAVGCPGTDDGVAELPLGHLGHLGGSQDQRAVAQHAHGVGHSGHLPKLVQHDEDGDPAVAQSPQSLEQGVGGGRGEQSGGFVEQQDARLGGQRPDDLQGLPGLNRQIADPRGERGRAADLGHVVLPAPVEVGSPVDGVTAGSNRSEFQGLRHGERRRQ